MGTMSHHTVDKDALLQEGKLFCRIFLSYLWSHESYRSWEGKEVLARDLIETGRARCNVTRAALSHEDLTALLYRRTAKNPYWLNYALMHLALRNGFEPSHLADWVAICRTVAHEQGDPPLEGIEAQILSEYGLRIPMAIRPLIVDYMISRWRSPM